MRLEKIKNFVESELNICITGCGLKREVTIARQLYYELACIYCNDEADRHLSQKCIASYVGYKHANNLKDRREGFQVLLKQDNKYKKAFNKFKKVSKLDTNEDVRGKYKALLESFTPIVKNKELEKLIDSIDSDKEDLLIERLKVIIPMLNKAKFN